jgi:hypothetical protein
VADLPQVVSPHLALFYLPLLIFTIIRTPQKVVQRDKQLNLVDETRCKNL